MPDFAASLPVVIALAALAAWFNHRVLRLPATIGVMATSLALSLALVALDGIGVLAGLHAREVALVRAIDFSTLLMQGLLSMLLFAGALHVDVEALRAYRWQVAVLAFVGTALSTALVGALSFAVLGAIGLPVPFAECLLFGALISPTDPIAVIGILKSAGAPRPLEVVIAGESLFNDGVGVVLFTLVLGSVVDGGVPTVGQAAMLLLREAGGGLLFGAVLGVALSRLLRRIEAAALAVPLTLVAVVGGYALANRLGMSGPLAMVVAGLVVGGGRAAAVRDVDRRVDAFWERLDEMLNAVLFLLVGMEVVAIPWPVTAGRAALAGAAAVAIVLAARWLTTGWPVRVFRRAFRLPQGAAAVLTWGGLRGGISIALALSVPAGPWRETLVALTYAVVAFSILVQGLTFGRLVRATMRG